MAGRTRRVVWTRQARDGLDEIVQYIAEDSPQGAAKVLDIVLQTGASLSTLSDRGRIVPEVQDPTIRETFIYSYRMLYQVIGDEVLILALIHGARDFGRGSDAD